MGSRPMPIHSGFTNYQEFGATYKDSTINGVLHNFCFDDEPSHLMYAMLI